MEPCVFLNFKIQVVLCLLKGLNFFPNSESVCLTTYTFLGDWKMCFLSVPPFYFLCRCPSLSTNFFVKIISPILSLVFDRILFVFCLFHFPVCQRIYITQRQEYCNLVLGRKGLAVNFLLNVLKYIMFV